MIRKSGVRLAFDNAHLAFGFRDFSSETFDSDTKSISVFNFRKSICALTFEEGILFDQAVYKN